MRIGAFLFGLQSQGVRLRILDGHLKCEAPKGVLTPDRVAEIRSRKGEIIDFLSLSESSERGGIPPIEAISREGELPLSFAQQRAWILEQIQPGCPMHNLPGGWKLRGPLDVDALRAAFTEIQLRHEVIRSRFGKYDGRPVLTIVPQSGFDLPVEDIRAIPEAKRESELLARIAIEVDRPMDLEKGPLVCARLYRIRDDEYALFFMPHHIIWDAWSFDILLTELSEIYPALAAGKPSPLPKLPIQYVDYAAWERNLLSSDALAGDLDYWRDQLSGDLPILDMPTDFSRPQAVTYQGTSEVLELSAEVVSGLRELARQENATLFMIVLAAIKVVLCRYSNQDEITVGCPIENTTRPEIEPLIGYFVNMLVLRSRIDFSKSFRDFLGSVRETCLDAFTHQSLPFEHIVDELKLVRDTSRTPLFQAIFLFQDASDRAGQFR